MAREPFAYLTPQPKSRDPRAELPVDLTVAKRRELHRVLWPSDYSGRTSVRQWLIERNFKCLEEGFADLSAVQARYPDGTQKMVSFLGGASDFVGATRGMTEGEIAGLIKAWRELYPDSLLAEVLWPRLLMAAAWNERGYDWAANVAPERMKEFKRLNAVAMKQVQAFGPAARAHVLGHYVGLRAVEDNGATTEQIATFALEALRRFPNESGLAAVAGERMLPKWGAAPGAFEDFARGARQAVGAALADRIYASLYLQVAGLAELHLHPQARFGSIKAGLMELAGLGTFDGIVALQEFACARSDAEAMRRAQALWVTYAREPQLRAPQTDLDARCREWERTLPPARETELAKADSAAATPATPGANLFFPAAPREVARTLYEVDAGSWERLDTPAGEVLSCKVCEYPVQVLVAVGPPLAGFTGNEPFLASLASSDNQARAARAHTEQAAQLDASRGGYELRIESTGFASVDGVKAFRYESLLKLSRVTMRETALELVRKGRMLRIAVNRADGPLGRKEGEEVPALLGRIRLRPE